MVITQGSGGSTAVGDYVSASAGLNTYYAYFIEVPGGLGTLAVDLFDADVGAGGGGEAAANRDRARGGFDTSAEYRLYDPAGTLRALETADTTSPTGADNAWINLLDSGFPTYAGQANAVTGDATPTSLTVARPASTAAGDLLLFTLAKDGSGAINAPTGGTGGWTVINEGACPGGGGGSCRLGVFYRFALASDPATYTVTWSGGEEAAGAILRFTGVNTTTPIDVSGAATGTSASPTAPSATTTVANTLVVRIYGADDDDLSTTPYPAGHRGRYNLESSDNTGGEASGGGATTGQAAAGATGTAAFSLSASEEWRAVTVALRPAGGAPAAGHWELRVDESSAVTGGDDINAYGIRAHDGNSGSGGTELPIYYHSFGGFGTNDPSLTRNYTHYLYNTAGCTARLNDFDWDSNSGATGSAQTVSRTGAYSLTINPLSVNDAWQANTFGTWTTDSIAGDYGIWTLNVSITGYVSGGVDNGNYGVIYFGAPAAAAPPPTAQPQASTFRTYLPTDGGSAPVKPYLEQLLTWRSGPNPPQVGMTTTLSVTVRLVNPTSQAITFSTPSNLVSTQVPGAPVLYGGNAQVTQGTVVSQPAVGGSGAVTWNPGTVAAGATVILAYDVRFTPTSAGQRAVVTGTVTSNGTQGTYVDETGNTAQARATYTQGPLCELAATENLATHALLRRFDAFAEGGRMVLEWETGSELGSLGFRVYRLDASGRPQAVGAALVPAHGAPQGAVYRLADDGVSPHGPIPTYLLVEVDHQGRQRPFGPFTPEVDFARNRRGELVPTDEWGESWALPLPEGFLARRERGAEGAIEEASQAEELRRPGQASALKVLVREPGLYRLTAAEIAAGLGSDAATVGRWIERQGLRLTLQGLQVAWLGESGGQGLLFYGEAIDSPFSRDNVYRLEVGRGLAMRPAPLKSPAPTADPLTFPDSLHAEEDRFAATVLPLDPRSDYWFWEGILTGHPTLGAKAVGVDSPGVDGAGGMAELRVHLQGATASGIPGEHRAAVRLNGADLGETAWQGISAHTAVFPVDPSLLLDGPLGGGANTVQVEGVAVSGVALSAFYLDAADLTYPRFYRSQSEELLFTGAGNRTVTVGGFADPEIFVLDLADPWRPRLGRDATLDGAPGDYRVSLRPRGAGVPYFAVSAAGIRSPRALVPDEPSSLRAGRNQAEYLVVAPAELMAGAEALADYRRSQGLAALAVDLADVIDEFNASIPDPQALKDFLAHAYRSWREPPRYVALIGDGSSDVRNLLGFGDSLLPPWMVATPFGLFAADLAYGDVEGEDGVPEIAVGRIPVIDSGELADYLARLAAYEAGGPGPLPDRLALIADDPDQGADFAAQSDRLKALLGGRYGALDLHLGPLSAAGVRSGLFAELGAGTSGLVHYTGHGSSGTLADEGLLTLADVPALSAPGVPPFVLTALTCALSRFELPGFATLSEELLVAPSGGALAVWAPSGLSYHGEAETLARGLFNHLRESDGPLVLGDVVRSALTEYAAGGGFREMLDIYNLLGDPALVLRLAPASPPPPGGGGGGE